jgi:arginyl-tRNA synthetase
MSNIAKQLEQHFRTAIKSAFGVDADPLVGASQQEQFADYQSNAAMSLAKTLGKKPREIAEQIKAKLELAGMAQEVAIAGPGFINVKLSHAWIGQELHRFSVFLVSRPLDIPLVDAPQNIVVDYSGPNIAKEMHVGHLRSTIIGDAISRVLDFQGHKITRQNHIGDWGTQFGKVVFAIWYWVMACARNKTEAMQEQMYGWDTASLAKNDASKEQIVRRVADLTQQFITEPEEAFSVVGVSCPVVQIRR